MTRRFLGLFACASLALAASCASAGTRQPAAPAGARAPGVAGVAAAEARTAAAEPASRDQVLFQAGTLWTFDFPPVDHLRRRYGLELDRNWFDEARLAATRYADYCSASFVSPRGLVMTNHHCARECIEANSTSQTDLIANGFYARAPEEELPCQGIFLDQLVSVSDVTERIDQAVGDATDPQEVRRRRSAAVEQAERECGERSRHTCSVVDLYNGGVYSLYEYRRYGEVRLVFAPEGDVAFFGGDPDNFTYPRYDLDVAFVRAYENGVPASTSHHFRWSAEGARDGDVVFVIGNPGTTNRLKTLEQLRYLRDVGYPSALGQLRRRLAALEHAAARGGEQAMAVRDEIFNVENSIKAYEGYLSGLRDTTLLRRKALAEAAIRQAVGAKPELEARYGGAWDAIARAVGRRRVIAPERRHVTTEASQLLSIAGYLVRYGAEMGKPEEERADDFRGPRAQQVREVLEGQLQVDVQAEESRLARHFGAARDELGADHAFLRAALAGATPEDAARRLVGDSRLGDAGYRRSLLEGGSAAIAAASDPLLVLARAIVPRAEAIAAEAEGIEATEELGEQRIGRAIFELYGTDLPPDATFTLRISDGVVKGYPYNGTKAPYKTTFYGLYGGAAAWDNRAPWQLPQRWLERRDSLDLTSPMNFVSTNDIIGGNSGSPVINARHEIVGLIFDGNIEQLPNHFVYTDETARSVSVHSRGILLALRRVYDAGALADELEGRRETR
ncbi:MAG: S46 family peptidase [Gemmatimonadetes bacterium]|nr:S46 family peptidase [Gemmatimonadota bacterium]